MDETGSKFLSTKYGAGSYFFVYFQFSSCSVRTYERTTYYYHHAGMYLYGMN